MRTTIPLCSPIFWRRMDSYSWHRWRRQGVAPSTLKAKLEKKGYKVEDINEFVKKDSPLFIDVDAIPKAQPVFPKPPEANESHPLWHDVRIKLFNDTNFPFEGISQAQNFTKSIRVKKGLPEAVLEFGKSTKLANQDELVQRVIRHAYLWDCTLDKLPKLMNLDIPQFKFGRYYGIPAQRRNELLLKNFLQLCESKLPEVARTRMVTNGEEFQTVCQQNGSPTILKFNPMLTMLSKTPLKPMYEAIDKTAEWGLPDIYPFISVAGTSEVNIYSEEDSYPFPEESPFPYAHTTYFSHHIPGSHTHVYPRWTDNRFAGTTVLYNFATALLMARRKFGENVQGVLPEPITTQVVHITGQEFQFCVFQLNNATLDDCSESPVKNILWITPKINLFKTCERDEAREKLEGYNPVVFELFMGMYGSETYR